MNFTEQDLNEFTSECLELLDTAEKALLELDSQSNFIKNYDIIFRTFHNLKGSSGVMGFVNLQEHMHRLENLLSTYKNKASVPREAVEIFLVGVDQAKKIISQLKLSDMRLTDTEAVVDLNSENYEKNNFDSHAEFIEECREILSSVSLLLQKFEKQSVHSDDVDSFYRAVHTLKGSSYLFGYNELGDLAHAIESSLEPVRAQKEVFSTKTIEALFTCLDLCEKIVKDIATKSTETNAVEVSKTIAFLKLAKNISMQDAPAGNQEAPMEPEKYDPKVASLATASAAANSVATEGEKESASSIRVSVLLLDKLMSLMGEMVLVRNQVLQYSTRTDDLEFLNLSQKLNAVTGEIQGEMMKTRMQPIGNVLGKFSRVVRDISKELDKRIELSLSGSETELDKSLLEAIKDPLTHIIRNACDHGIEPAEERRRNGKPESGQISVNSYHEGGQVIIEIKDDGRGLNKTQLTAKALEKGLITQVKAQTMNEREAFNLIFAPGFSTSKKVTNLSGRGVGMDVVRTNIEKIGGSVELQSQTGLGTGIKLRIPLTLAIVPAMIVKASDDYFAIPQLKLVELVRVDQNSDEKIEFIHNSPVFRLRGQILPVVSLKNALGDEKSLIDQNVVNLVVLKSDEFMFGLAVDEIQDTADIVVKPLSRFLKPIEVFSGATVLGDGSVALILDVLGLVKSQISNKEQINDTKSTEVAGDSQMKISEMQDFLLVKIGGTNNHAVLLNYVNRLEEFKTSAIEVTGKQKLVRYRDSVLPLIFISELLGEKKPSKPNSIISVVVIEKSDTLYGLVVDEIVDVLTTEKDLDTTLSDGEGILGNLVLDEEAVVVLDPFVLIDRALGLSFAETEARSATMNTTQGRMLGDDDDDEVVATPKNKTKKYKRSERKSENNRILYVEDTVFFRKHVTKVLESAGYEVSCAKDGLDALRVLENNPIGHFSVVLSDIEMPNMNGLKFAETLRAHKKFADLPLIALSTKASEKQVNLGLKAGFQIYLEKLNAEELLKALSDYKLKAVS